MTRFPRSIFIAFSLAVLPFAPLASSADQPARCTECGMRIDPGSKFVAQMNRNGKTLPFCDIGDLLVYLNKNSLPPSGAMVKDYVTGDWIGAEKAFYVHAESTFSTPMGWGIAAFAKKEEAAAFGAPLDITAVLKAVK